MLVAEHETFITELQTVAKVMRSRELDDQELAFYWDTLKDRPLADVLRRLRDRAKRGKFMPKPAELRPREDEKFESSQAADANSQAAARYNAESWRQLRLSDPQRFSVLYPRAAAARALCGLEPGSPVYDQAWLEYRAAP